MVTEAQQRSGIGITGFSNELVQHSAAWSFCILVAVPLSMIGAILGLWVMRLPFGFMAFLGIVSLSGVVTNHAIVQSQHATIVIVF